MQITNSGIMKKKIVWILFLLLGSFAFLLFESPYTSILNPYYGLDSAVYMLMGRGWRYGALPYVDLYDHKGPFIYLINAIAFVISDSKFGILLLQTINLAICFYFIYKIAELMVAKKYAWLSIVIFMFLYCATISEGNMTEEWSLLFSLIPLYLTLKFFLFHDNVLEWKKSNSLILGVCIGIHAMIRINNASIVAGIVLGFAIVLLCKKEFVFLLNHAVMVLIGILIAIAPFALYFFAKGAFDSFLFGTFIHNWVYAAEGVAAKTGLDLLVIVFRILYCPILILLGWMLKKKDCIQNELLIIWITTAVCSAFLMLIGNGWIHYYLTNVPIMIVTCTMAGRLWMEHEAGRRWVCGILIAACLMPFTWQAARHVGKNILFDFFGYYDQRVESVNEIMSYIPENEKESIWAYDVNPSFYMYANVLPCYKYFSLQSYMAPANSDIDDEISAFITAKPPQYIVVNTDPEIKNDDMKYVMENRYELICATDYGLKISLYRKK